MAGKWSTRRNWRRINVDIDWSLFEVMIADMQKKGIDELSDYVRRAVANEAQAAVQSS